MSQVAAIPHHRVIHVLLTMVKVKIALIYSLGGVCTTDYCDEFHICYMPPF